MRFPRALAMGMAFAFAAGPAFAERDPTPDERARIEAALTHLGFSDWEEIELEDDESAWEVDDARGPDGRDYELKLDPNSLEIISQELDG